jgi:hypothetical protein
MLAVLAIYSGIILPKGIVVKSPTAKIIDWLLCT